MNPDGARVPLKVLHVAQTAQGGVGSYLEEIVPQWARLYGADSVRVVIPDAHAHLFPGLKPQWLVTFRNGDGGRMMSSLRMAGMAMLQIWKWRPAVVHLHSTFAGLVMRPLLALMPRGPRVVYCPHGWAFNREGTGVGTRAIALVERVLARFCDAIVCVSRFDAGQARAVGIRPGVLVVVLNGVSDVVADSASVKDAARQWPEGCLRLLFVGRLDHQKGVDVFYEALRKLGEGAFGVVVGAPVVGDEAAVQPPANARALGWRTRPQTASLYAAADVLVVPSRWEAFGLVTVEAMRAGLPVIATRVGGIPEAVEDGVTGRLIDVDAPWQLVAVLGCLDAPTRHSMSINARRRFLESFRTERVVQELDELYRKLRPV
ncbi:MAG: glycosyltransferase [Ramlibacter sp.]|nr:glycosyltransferase [Ramlibacter sp.]